MRGDLRRAVASLEEESPGARVLPTWSEKPQEIAAGGLDPGRHRGIGTVRAASRFYFGVSLVPWSDGDASQPGLVWLRHPGGAGRPRAGEPPPFRDRFEREHGLVPVFRGRDGSLHRTRPPPPRR